MKLWGNKPDSAIVAIAAVPFDMISGVTDDALFYEVINLRSSEKYGGSIDADTVLWWLGKSKNARGKITNSTKMIDLPVALTRLNSFAFEFCEERVQVWGNGSNFDNVILRTAYENCEINPFWRHWNDRDVRTIVERGRNPPAFI
ncbi:3'-5' exonuclease [Morganella morganii]|uniref:3'-5' exonuclease n=1 Tax=Morganella TaxID=581 RepID=UPI00370C928C